MEDFNIIAIIETRHIYQDYDRFCELHCKLEEDTGLENASEVIYPRKTHTVLVQNGLNILLWRPKATRALADNIPILSLASHVLYERGLLTDADLQGFEFTLSVIRNMFPANTKWVRFLMERNNLQYWYGTVDISLTLEHDNVV